MKNKPTYSSFAVLGLGRFGMSIVHTLSEYDVSILACDRDEATLHRAADYATHVVQADLSDEAVLQKLGLGNFDVVILAMGSDFEASQIAAMVAKESGAARIVVKALTRRQKSILQSMGIHEVILPEHEMGAKLARRMVGFNIMDILEESAYYTITEMRPLDDWVGKTIRQADIRREHGLTILAVRNGEKLKIPVLPDTVLTADDILITLEENRG